MRLGKLMGNAYLWHICHNDVNIIYIYNGMYTIFVYYLKEKLTLEWVYTIHTYTIDIMDIDPLGEFSLLIYYCKNGSIIF